MLNCLNTTVKMKKKLILFMPSIEIGGVEKNFIIIANYFAKHFDELSIITTSKKYKKEFDQNIKLIIPQNKIWEKTSRRVKFLVSLFYLIIEFFKNKEVKVFCFQANLYCILVCKIFMKKIIIRSNSSPDGWSQNPLKKFLYKKILKLSDKIIVNSLKFKKQLKTKFDLKSYCIYNPLNSEDILKLSKQSINKNKLFKKKNLKLINVARLEDQKDHQTLLKAMLLLKNKINFQLIIIGGGKNRNQILKLINEYNLKKIVKLKPFIKNPYPYMKISDCFILSSIYEGLPNVLLEAILLDNFIISSNCPTGPSEILDNNKGGLLFKTSSPEDLVKKILFFYKNKKICLKKKQFAKKRLSRFDYQDNLKKYLLMAENF